MRVKISKTNSERLFNVILQKYKNRQAVADEFDVSVRTVNDWRRGKYSLPLFMFRKFISISDLRQKDLSPKLLPDFWHIRDAARLGGITSKKLYGNFGTPEGRRRGGLASLATHKKKQTRFKTLKVIKKPKYSEAFAEFMGILFGDGHLSEYQIGITTNSKTDRTQALFVRRLIKDLFDVSAALKNKDGENTLNIVVSSKALVEFLHRCGMPKGNKIQNRLAIPDWIPKNLSFLRAFIRGLFDTDGCIYLDIHRKGGKVYKHLGWTITSYADKLREGVMRALRNFGFSPTYRISQRSVYLRRQEEIARYFREISTHNPKHRERYKEFIGRVPKRS